MPNGATKWIARDRLLSACVSALRATLQDLMLGVLHYIQHRTPIRPGGNLGAERQLLDPTPIQMLPLRGSICGRLTWDLFLGCLQGGCAHLRVRADFVNFDTLNRIVGVSPCYPHARTRVVLLTQTYEKTTRKAGRICLNEEGRATCATTSNRVVTSLTNSRRPTRSRGGYEPTRPCLFGQRGG